MKVAKGKPKNPQFAVSIKDKFLGMVEGLDIVFNREQKHVLFTIRKWLTIPKEDFLLDLFNNKTRFELVGKIGDNKDFSITITDCRIHRYRPITGAGKDIIAEEVVGEGIYMPMPTLPVVFLLDGEKIFDDKIYRETFLRKEAPIRKHI